MAILLHNGQFSVTRHIPYSTIHRAMAAIVYVQDRVFSKSIAAHVLREQIAYL